MDTRQSTENQSVTPIPVQDSQSKTESLLPCCRETIDMHAARNPMMVCPMCKQIIKYFTDERAFKNYCNFCASRHRNIIATKYNDIFVVTIRSYEMYTK